MKIISILVLLGAIAMGCTSNKRYDAFHPAQPWLDDNNVHINAHGGGLLYHHGTYYWYGEHKVAGGVGNTAQVGVHVYASNDLYNWEDKGIALSVDSTDANSEIALGSIIERPKVIYNEKTQKFVMWFHLELLGQGYDAARSGIAISDAPTGPFTYVKSVRPNQQQWPQNVKDFHLRPVADTIKAKYCGGKGCLPAHVDSLNLLGRDFHSGQMARDMNLFVDDDGKAYHLYSSEENSTMHIAELTDDYLDHSSRYVRVFPGRYMEAPTVFKTSKGKYYFIASDCTGWAPNEARSAVADHIFGPWTELGNPCIGKDSVTTFHSQSNYILPIHGRKDAFIFMADRWMPENPIDGKHIWLPIQLKEDKLTIEWQDKWDLSVFKR